MKHRHEKSRELLFHGLRSAPAGQVDSLTVHRTYTVLEVDAGSCQAMLDPPLDSRGHSTWKLNNEPVAISVIADVTCSFEGAICPEPGDEVEQVQWLASHKDLVEEFLSLWQPRWQKLPSQSDWTRITAFAAAFLPCLDLQLPPISVPQWRRAIQRFKPRAARGPDAFGKQDLLHMPVRELLFLLHSVEQGHCEWPQQWLLGFVCALSKANGRLDANGFRPICLMSMIYRTWSGLRARFLLRKLAVFTQYQAHGFLPGHEAAQVWYYTQALVELACQGDFDLVGMSCDLVKAFNNLPRDPLFQVASLLGVPEALTRPWMQFLAKFERRFLIRRHVGASVLSTCGFPEGCPLSTAAMAITDLVFHAYMTVFSPRVSSFSFVDNLGFTAPDPGGLAQGYNTAQCFVDMLGLELDREKTYVWAVKAPQRKQLALMGLPVLEHARDLGGLMSYGRSVRNASLRARMQELSPLWKALTRSPSPTAFKLSILSAKMWAKALHGISGCPASPSDFKLLRTAAVRAIGHAPAGSSPQLRLTLSLNILQACPRAEFVLESTFCTQYKITKRLGLYLENLYLDTMEFVLGRRQSFTLEGLAADGSRAVVHVC